MKIKQEPNLLKKGIEGRSIEKWIQMSYLVDLLEAKSKVSFRSCFYKQIFRVGGANMEGNMAVTFEVIWVALNV
jgi:hypothetical protein